MMLVTVDPNEIMSNLKSVAAWEYLHETINQEIDLKSLPLFIGSRRGYCWGAWTKKFPINIEFPLMTECIKDIQNCIDSSIDRLEEEKTFTDRYEWDITPNDDAMIIIYRIEQGDLLGSLL